MTQTKANLTTLWSSCNTKSNIFCNVLEGNQYTYKGNTHFNDVKNGDAVQDAVSMAIQNQEMGKSPIEYTNQLSRAKIIEMKGIKVQEQVRSYQNLY